MLKKEWQGLFKNKFMLVVLIAIITIPTIYTSIFLGSMWDPYGNVESLPVAIVNKDKAVDYEGETMNVGEELVDNLKENNSLDFNFVDEDTAEAGLKNGTYYMVVTIPENFSYNATTLMDENPQKMELEYKTNPGTNYIASKMSESAITKIRTEVAEKITKQYSETIFDQLAEIGDGFDDATEATETMGDGVEKLKDGSDTLSEKLTTLSESSLTFKDGAETLDVAVGTYTDAVSQINDGAGTLKDGLDTLADGADTLADAAPQLAEGAESLDTAVNSYTSAVSQIYDGSKQLAANNEALNDGVATLADGTKSLKSASKSILTGLKTMSATLGDSLSDENKAQIATLQGGITQVNEGLQTLNTAVQSVDLSNVSTLVTTVKSGMESVAADTQSAATNLAGVQSDIKTIVGQVKASENLTDEQKAEVLGYISALTSEDGNLSKAGQDLKSIGTTLTGLNEGLSGADLSALDSISTLKDSVNTLATSGNTVLSGASTVISSQQAGLEAVQDALDREGKTADQMGLIQGMSALYDGTKTLNTAVNSKTGLKASVETYTDGVATVNSALKELKSNNSALNSGATSLDTAIGTLTDKIPTLTGGITKLQTGAQTLSNGTTELVSNNDDLTAATGTLADAAGQISDGSGKLADGAETLSENLTTLQDGVTELHDALSDAADEIHETNATDDTYDMIASPVENVGSEESSVDNNGTAMAAYMMGVGLWVACIAFCIMYPLTKPSTKIKNSFSWWLSKASVVGTIAVLQGVVMVFMLKWILGFNPKYLGKTLLIAVLASLAFMAIMYFFNLLMGKVGSFILLVFMVLQLGGSAGTYPLDLSGDFYKVIHPFMPFSYSVDAFRATIATGQSIATPVAVFVGMIVVFTSLTIVFFHFKAKKVTEEENEMFDSAEAVLE